MLQRRWATVAVEVPAAFHWVRASHDQQLVVAEVTYTPCITVQLAFSLAQNTFIHCDRTTATQYTLTTANDSPEENRGVKMENLRRICEKTALKMC